jgi:hypothetical protein
VRNRNPNFSAARTRERLERKAAIKSRETRRAEAFVSRAIRTLSAYGCFAIVAFIAFHAAPYFGALPSGIARTPEEISQIEGSVYYSGCNEARAAGAAPIHAGEPGYRSEMDGDDDGIACEPRRRF